MKLIHTLACKIKTYKLVYQVMVTNLEVIFTLKKDKSISSLIIKMKITYILKILDKIIMSNLITTLQNI